MRPPFTLLGVAPRPDFPRRRRCPSLLERRPNRLSIQLRLPGQAEPDQMGQAFDHEDEDPDDQDELEELWPEARLLKRPFVLKVRVRVVFDLVEIAPRHTGHAPSQRQAEEHDREKAREDGGSHGSVLPSRPGTVVFTAPPPPTSHTAASRSTPADGCRSSSRARWG